MQDRGEERSRKDKSLGLQAKEKLYQLSLSKWETLLQNDELRAKVRFFKYAFC